MLVSTMRISGLLWECPTGGRSLLRRMNAPVFCAESVTSNGRIACRAGLPVQCSVCNTDVELDEPSRSGHEVKILECNHTVHLRCFSHQELQQKVFRCPDCGEVSR